MTMLVNSGRVALAKYIMSCPIFLAIGNGEASWDEVREAPSQDVNDIIAPMGFKKLTAGYYVVEDAQGAISVPSLGSSKKFSMSPTPTRHIYCRFQFDYGEGVGGKIRELGIFINTQVADNSPAEKTYFAPNEIKSRGDLLVVDYPEDPDVFNPQKRGAVSIVVTI